MAVVQSTLHWEDGQCVCVCVCVCVCGCVWVCVGGYRISRAVNTTAGKTDTLHSETLSLSLTCSFAHSLSEVGILFLPVLFGW